MFQKTMNYINEHMFARYHDLIFALARDDDADDIITYVTGDGCAVIYNYFASLERAEMFHDIDYDLLKIANNEDGI